MRKLQIISPIFFLLVIASGYFWYLTFSGRIQPNPVSDAMIATVRTYPELTGAKTIALTCAYRGQNLKVEQTLYGSLDDYYGTNPAKRSAYYHNQNEKYVFSYEEDKTIGELAGKIKAIGTEKSLDSDQTLDLAACLLQSIPYDTEKAARILSPDYFKLPVEQLLPRYPYETLYEGKGICTDKSFLGVAIFRELGYSTSLLTFDAQRHMSIGIEVPPEYGEFGTKYSIMELTGANFLVGDIPEISGSAGLAVGGVETLPNVTTDSPTTLEKKTKLDTLSKSIPISAGNVYLRIAEREALKNQIADMKPQLITAQEKYNDEKVALSVREASLRSAEAGYKADPSAASYSTYTTTYNAYSKAYNLAISAVDKYNSMVNEYNALVTKYKQF